MMLVTRFVAAIGLAAVAAAQGPALEARATTSLPSGCISLPGIGFFCGANVVFPTSTVTTTVTSTSTTTKSNTATTTVAGSTITVTGSTRTVTQTATQSTATTLTNTVTQTSTDDETITQTATTDIYQTVTNTATEIDISTSVSVSTTTSVSTVYQTIYQTSYATQTATVSACPSSSSSSGLSSSQSSSYGMNATSSTTPLLVTSSSSSSTTSSSSSTATTTSSSVAFNSSSAITSSSSTTTFATTTPLANSTTSATSSSTCAAASSSVTAVVNQTTCGGNTYTYQQLAGYGFNPSNATDSAGDTIGGIGSGIALDKTAWTKLANGSYTGVLWALPDRGWNTEGTLNYQGRVHKFNILFTPQPCATAANPSAPNLQFFYSNTIFFTGPDGTPTTGLDADGTGHLSFDGFPDLPVATYTGDGFGGGDMTQTHQRIPVDHEGIVLNSDGSFWISDEYGPYVYHYDVTGRMTAAIRPPDAIIPMRNGSESFSADSPYYYHNMGAGDDVSPADGPSGRNNNHGFEGLTTSADGTQLYFLLQAATNQDGGTTKQTEQNTRFLQYDVSNPSSPVYVNEWVVPLPFYNDPTSKTAAKAKKVAAQSEILRLTDTQFMVLARDSSAGNGQSVTTSVYRHADIFDISSASSVKNGMYDCANCSVSSTAGVLKSTITPATYCSFLDFNVNGELNKFTSNGFAVHNGGSTNSGLLNEKWESLSMVPVDGANGADGEYYLFSLSDNDFITQNGHLEGGQFAYADGSGYNLDVQALVFQVKLPAGVNP